MAVPGTSANPLYTHVADAAPATISDTTYDANGNLLTWTQDGVDYEATYDANDNLLTQGPV